MGESITEGTVDVILKQPGDAVQQDEVICTIATDKVRWLVESRVSKPTHSGCRMAQGVSDFANSAQASLSPVYLQVAVDVRSPVSGVLKSFAAQEDEEVEVGSVLAHIDTDGEVSSSNASSGSKAASNAPAPAPAPKEGSKPAPAAQSGSAQGAAASSDGRRPMIQFRHGKANTKSSIASSSAAAGSAAGAVEASFDFEAAFPSKTDKTYLDLPPMYGRPAISAAEAEAIDMGGVM